MLAELVSMGLNLPPLVYVVIVLVTVWFWMTRSSHQDNIPPFPCRPHPLVGHALMMKSGPLEKLHEWRQTTGDIFSIYQGRKLVVVLNTVKLMKESLVTQGDAFSDRQRDFLSTYVLKSPVGIVLNSGPGWREQRTVSMSILKNFGMGKNFLAEKISAEVKIYLKSLTDLRGEPTNVRLLTNASVSNVICAIILGERFELDDPFYVELLRVMNDQTSLVGNMSLINSFPWLRYIPGDLFKAKRLMSNSRQIGGFGQKFIADELKKEDSQEVDSLIKAYLIEMDKRRQKNIPTYLDENNLKSVLSNLFFAGTETTSSTLIWAMLYAIHYPESQEKVYQEIMNEVGSERLPSIQDRSRMNYTNAFIMETQRLGSVVPLSVPHLCNADSRVAGYTIPKGTVIIPNLDEVLKDEQTWGDPLVFRPTRFLDKDNNLLVPEEFIPFSIGRRYCMGESLARMELFLYVTGLIQQFHIQPEDPDNLPPLKPAFGITVVPQPYKPRLIQRKSHT